MSPDDRSKYPTEIRLALLEDAFRELEESVDKRLTVFGVEVKTVKGVMIGLLISITTATIVAAITLGFGQ